MFPKKSVFLILLFISILSFAQQPYYRHYTVNDGLASSTVYKIIQDRKGFIWIATENGAQRFDGKTFETFSKENGLLDNTILDLFEDSKGRIWFLSLSGQIAYYDNGNIHTTVNDSILKQVDAKSNLNYIEEDTKGRVYISALSGVYIINNQEVKNYRSEVIGFTNYLWNVQDTVLGIGGATLFSKPNNEIRYNITYSNKMIEIKDKNIQISRYVNTSINNFIVSADKLYSLNVSGNGYRLQGFALGNLGSIYNLTKSINHDLIWVMTNKGVHLFDKEKKAIISTYLSDQIVNTVLEDKEGILWFGTMGGGLFILNRNNFFSISKSDGLSENVINDIILDGKKRLWLGYNNGQIEYLFDKKLNKALNDLSQEKWARVNQFALDNDSLIGIASEGIIKSIEFKYNSLFVIKNNQGGGSIKAITKNIDGHFWLGDVITLGTICNNIPFYFNAKRISSLLETKKKVLWVGSVNGLVQIDSKKTMEQMKTIERKYSLNANIENNTSVYDSMLKANIHFISLPKRVRIAKELNVKYDYSSHYPGLKSRINDIEESGNHTIWVATHGSGIYSIKNDTTVQQYSVSDGLSSSICKVIKIENDSLIWLGTNKGLNKLTFSNNQINVEVFNSANGLISDDVNAIELQGDTVWVATSGGLSFFNKNNISKNLTFPPVYITKIQINNSDTILLDQYNLKFSQNSLNLKFIGLAYQLPEKVSYKYKLDNIQNDWLYTSDNNIKYDYLPAGDYTFQVYAKSPDGIWSLNSAKVTFHISPPFYQTWWFYLSAFSLVSGIISFAFWYRLRQIKKQDQLKLKILEGELKALRSQMNPHFIFNSLNSIQYFISQSNTENAQKYLSKFSKLLRKILENSRQSSISLTGELEALKLYLEIESLRFNHQFKFSIDVAQNVDSDAVYIPPMILQPFVENAILHGIMPKNDSGLISIRIELDSNFLKCEIEDDGVGRSESAKSKSELKESHKSLGMTMTQERLESMTSLLGNKASVEIIDKENEEGISTGTLVRILIPAEAVN